MEIRAAVLHEAGRPLAVERVELDGPRAGEVLVRVAAAGVCHTDLHLADGHLGDGRWPVVLGHEGAGVVEAVGAGVTAVAPGDRVAFCFVPSCLALPRVPRRALQPVRDRPPRTRGRARCSTAPRGCGCAGGAPLQHFNFVSCFAERCVVPEASAVAAPGRRCRCGRRRSSAARWSPASAP